MPRERSVDAASRPGGNPFFLATPFYRKFNGGLNVRESGINIRDDQLSVATNILYSNTNGSLEVRNGYSSSHFTDSTPIGSGSVLGMIQAFFVSGASLLTRFVACNGASIAALVTRTGAWTDITGGLVRSTPTNNRVWFGQINNLLIGSDGTNAPFKWAGDTGVAAVALGGSPPTAELGFEWNGFYFFIRNQSAPNRLYYSAIGDPDSWPAANFIDIPSPFDGDPIMGYGFTYGNLLIYKRRSIYLITGKTASEFRVDKLNASYGMMSVQACCSVENASWFVSDRGIYEIDGVNITYISYWIEPRYTDIGVSHASVDTKPIGVYHSKLHGRVYVTVDFDNDGTYDRVLAYDYMTRDEMRQPAISEFTYQSPALAPVFFATLVGTDSFLAGVDIIIASRLNTTLYRDFGPATNDDSVNNTITAVARFRDLDLGDPTSIKTVRFLRVLTDDMQVAADSIDIHLSPNGLGATTVNFAVSSSDNIRVVMPAGVMSSRNKFVAFGIRFANASGTRKIFYGYQLEYLMTGRRL